MKKISNQTVHHQSGTKFDSMLQDIKKLQACKTKNIFCISDIAPKKIKLLIFLIMSIRLTNNFPPVKYRHRKKIATWKTEGEDKRVVG